jgi:CubicO group peptidase (beta-lactamase class C family)
MPEQKKFNLNLKDLTTVFLLTLILSLSACKDAGNNQSLEFLKDNKAIDASIDSLVNQKSVPFLYARIEGINGEVLYEHSAINTNLYPDLTLDKNTWFRVWSMSKIVTISVAMDLVEDGLLNLDDPVINYIPEFESLQVAVTNDGQNVNDIPWGERNSACPLKLVPMTEVMTIEHLLNHEAGFYYPWTNYSCLDSLQLKSNIFQAKNSDDLVQVLSKFPLVNQPGEAYHYGVNTTVLGIVAERVTGKSLKTLVEERITRPMNIEGLQYKLTETTLLPPRTLSGDSLIKLTANNKNRVLGGSLPLYDQSNILYLGGEGMIATTDGYADFARMLLNKGELNGYRLLDEETIELIASPHTQLDNPWGYNGYNLWVTGDTLRALEIGEGGLWVGGGYEGTYFWIDTKRKFVGLIMTQLFDMRVTPSDAFRGAVYREIWEHED